MLSALETQRELQVVSEHLEQVAVITWARLLANKYPELRLLHAIPNGGLRNRNVARKLQAEGVVPGIPDLFLPVGRGNFHGLYIEMKYGRNKLTKAQSETIKALRQQNYAVAVCYSAERAIELITAYLQNSSSLFPSVASHYYAQKRS